MAYWIHLWRAPEGGQDVLYILGNVPCTPNKTPREEEIKIHLSDVLADISDSPVPEEFDGSKAAEILYTTQNILLYDLVTYEEIEVEKNGEDACLSLKEDGYFIAPSGRPIPIPAKTILEFYPPEKVRGTFDSRALVNFRTPDGKRWKACYLKKDKDQFGQPLRTYWL